jgi:iron complex outermembrane receptor protein
MAPISPCPRRGMLPALLLTLPLAAPAPAAVIEEVVVTATKREESAQDIPISVTAFSAETIEALGFTQSYDVASHVPNMQFMAEASQSTPFIFLRGIGNTSFFPNSINPVAVYIDNAYVGQNVAQGFQLFDLERVEVLRGPQGTLFGRNATGGLVNFITRKPEIGETANARVKLTAGDYGRFDAEAAGSLPLGERAAVRVAGFQQLSSGMYDHVAPGIGDDDYGDVDNLALRGQIRWQPVDELDLLFNAHWGDDNSHLTAEKPGYIASPFGVPNCPPGALSGALNNGCSDPFGLGQSVDPDFDHVQFTYAPYQDLETWGVALEAHYDLGNHTLTSLTAWDTVDMARLEDDDANVRVIMNDTFHADAEWFSQELRLTSEYDGRLNWILGGNYYVDDLKSNLIIAAAELPPPPGIPFPLGLAQDLHQETDTWAVFGELTWDIDAQWTLRLGGRITENQRAVDMNTFAFIATLVRLGAPIPFSDALAAFAFPLIPETERESDWLEWSGRAALDWEFSEKQMLYASASRGFKGGEFNGGALFHVTEAVIADPEFMNNYEIGYKGTLLDGRLQANVTGFYMEYDDQQVLISNPTPFGILPNLQNAGSSGIKGVEFDLAWQPTAA